MWLFGDDYEELKSETEARIKQDGYPLEKYSVSTEDNYINTMYRIPHGKNEDGIKNNNKQRPPIILSHGLTCCCAIFVNECKLAYYLADNGFDVWLPNNRGTTFSRKHKVLNPDKDKKEYWNFSWHEIGVYDIPAFIDFVLEKTGFDKLFFVGHSQGVTCYVAFASERVEYNEKIALAFLFGPPVIFENNDSLIVQFGGRIYLKLLEFLYKYTGLPLYELPFTYFSRALASNLGLRSLNQTLNQTMLFLIGGHPDFEQTAEVNFSESFRTMPNGASVRQIIHYGQIIRSGKFAKYDYGCRTNKLVYGKTTPPQYDLSKITSPIALYYGKNDMFTHKKDVRTLEQKLGNVVNVHEVEYDLFNHVDFLLAKDAIPLVYCHMLKLMSKYMPQKSS